MFIVCKNNCYHLSVAQWKISIKYQNKTSRQWYMVILYVLQSEATKYSKKGSKWGIRRKLVTFISVLLVITSF